jgi:hypothetical protein
MPTARPFSYNTGSTISGTIQVGDLAVGIPLDGFASTGLKWWSGPDEDLGYVIAHPTPAGNQPNQFSIPAYLGFWRSDFKTEESFIELAEYVSVQDNDPQTFVDGEAAITWLNANGYWTSFTPKTPYSELQTIAEYLRGYMSEFRNPSFYNYQLDGSGYEISDGGGDMYDGGNISSPWIISNTEYIGTNGYSSGAYPYAVDYTNSATTSTLDTSFGYISLGYQQYNGVSQSSTYLPLTVLGSRDSDTYGDGLPVGFQTGGNSGADGGGALASGSIYSGETVSGFTTYAFFRETYNAGDPSHCDLYILLGHPNWNSTFGTVSSFAQPVNQGGCGGYLYTTGVGTKNILAIKTLLSKNGGQLVTSAECQTVVNNFIIRVKQSQGF